MFWYEIQGQLINLEQVFRIKKLNRGKYNKKYKIYFLLVKVPEFEEDSISFKFDTRKERDDEFNKISKFIMDNQQRWNDVPKNIKDIQNMLFYAPEGPGYEEAKTSFNKLKFWKKNDSD